MAKSKILLGDAFTVLATSSTLPRGEFHSLITSPPYWDIVDYKVRGQLGQETFIEGYIKKLKAVFYTVKDYIMNPRGTIWLNIGDRYNSKGKVKRVSKKSLLMIPERLAWELTNNGFILRNKIVWWKPNAMPSPTKDRFIQDWEMIYVYSLQDDYQFFQQLEPYTKPLDRWGGDDLVANGESKHDKATGQTTYRDRKLRPNPKGRKPRSVWVDTAIWDIPTGNRYLLGTKYAHPSVFPPEMIETPILSSTKEGDLILDPFLGVGTTIIKALEMGREAIGIELNPEYAEIAQALIKKHTGRHVPIEKGAG